MIVVSNTTPLRYLFAIREEHLFPELFGRIHIPLAVYEELNHPKTPAIVKTRISDLPSWLEVHRDVYSESKPLPRRVHRGESAAIALAGSLRADLLLIDDRDGRIAAANHSFRLSGTLGVLEMAHSLGLIADFRQVLKSLVESGFHLKPAFFNELLERNK